MATVTAHSEALDRAALHADRDPDFRGLNVATCQLRPGDCFIQTYLEKVNGTLKQFQREVSVTSRDPGTILLRGRPLPAWSVQGIDTDKKTSVQFMATDGARWDVVRTGKVVIVS